MSDIDSVLRFWFGNAERDADVFREAAGRWFKKDEAFDAEIRRQFGDLHAKAAAGKLGEWAESPRGRLALIIVLDQFSRNLYRNDPRAFSCDDRALGLAREGIEAGDDTQLRVVERSFFYMPFMHSENLQDQERCIELFENLLSEAPEDCRASIQNNVKYARAHRDIVARFGRFPHRNAALGRQSTAEETEFLQQPGSSF